MIFYKDKARKADPFLKNASEIFKKDAPQKAAKIWPQAPAQVKKEILNKIRSSKEMRILKK